MPLLDPGYGVHLHSRAGGPVGIDPAFSACVFRSKCGEVVAGGQQARASGVHAGAGLSASPDSGKICSVGTDDGTVGADPQTVKEQGFDRFHAL